MNQINQIKEKRKRISKGQLVASSNTIVYSCIKALEIFHYYNPLNYNRVLRVVETTSSHEPQNRQIILNT